jgi:hypothetical protein
MSIPIEQDPRTTLSQIGNGTILGISGGRTHYSENTLALTLPVSNGYRVVIHLMSDDTYRVQRTFTRGAKTWVKAERDEVYCDELSEIAYKASCFHSYDSF